MDPVEGLLVLLGSPSAQIRTRAARALSGLVNASHRTRIVAAERAEKDSYVKLALGQLLDELGQGPAQYVKSTDDILAPSDEARLRGEQDALRQFIHEIVPLYGLVARNAAREFENFANSRTRLHLQRMLRYIEAMKELSEAQSTPSRSEFDLADCVGGEAIAVGAELNWEVAIAGPTPLLVDGSLSLVSLIVSNALRNAIEAERSVKTESTVIVSWGETAVDYWVSVIDRGVGISPKVGRVFSTSVSSKENHAGMGLAIARRAASSIGAELSLTPNAERGTTFTLRWQRISRAQE